MKFLTAIGAMRFFKAQPWMFVLLGFVLLAFVLPLGVAFVVSALCAGSQNPSASNNFIVLLKPVRAKQEHGTPQDVHHADKSDQNSDRLDAARATASIHHVGILRAIDLQFDDDELAASALGALDGTMQSMRLKLSPVDMHTNGAAFVIHQLQEFDRIKEPDPDYIADLTVNAMSSDLLSPIREQASQFAFEAEQMIGFGRLPEGM